MNIGIDHGYYAIKTRHFSFPAGIAEYSHEPYTLQNTLEFGGKFYVCGTGRQPILRNKMENDNYYLLTLAAIAKEIKQRGGKTECSVRIAAGLPLAGFGREKKPFREYLLRSSQPVCFKFEGISYKITIEDVKLFPQGYSAIALHPELVQNEPSVLLMDIGGWTVDLMRLDKINNVGFWDSIPLWAVTLLGGLFITVLSFIMILTVYSRLFKLYMYTAIAPIPMSTFAGEPTSNVGKNFLRSYAGVCLEGAIIALACIIFSVMAASPPAVDPNVSAVTAVWSYVGELIFNLLVLVGAVRMSDRIVKELLGL